MIRLTLPELRPGMVLAREVYASAYASAPFLLRGARLTLGAIRRLRDLGVDEVYIDDGTVELPEPTPRVPLAPGPGMVRSRVAQPTAVLDERLRVGALQSLEKTFDDIVISDEGVYGTPETTRELGEMVGLVVSSLARHTDALLNINDLKSFDDYTYHHSLSVAVLSIGIGQQLGFATPKLNRLGMSAIMHDIGKTAVPVEIIRKPAKLSAREFDMVKAHARAGTGYLIGSSVGDEALWRAVLFHHERLDGTGYPVGLKGGEIPLWSRIISVADVYDALTSARPYRQPMPPADALEYIMGGVGTAFDYDVVAALVAKVDLYPVGSCIELSNGRVAVVLDNENQMRPVVELAGTGEVVDLYRERRWLNVVVRRVLPDGEARRWAANI